MKKTLLILSVTLAGLLAQGFAASPPVQEQGAVEISTSISISVSTTAMLAYTTGYLQGRDSGSSSYVKPSTAPPIIGQYMPNRLGIEFFNDCSTDVWVDNNVNISTMPGVNYGRRLVPGASIVYLGSVRDYYVKASTTTEKKLVITQVK